MTATGIAQDKIDAYLVTQYRVAWAGAGFILQIGTRSADLAAVYRTTGTASALFITAFNPLGRARPDDENIADHQRLRAELLAGATLFAEGEGADPSGAWPAEKSFLVLGVDERDARALGTRYRQDAVVWAGPDALPHLLLLR